MNIKVGDKCIITYPIYVGLAGTGLKTGSIVVITKIELRHDNPLKFLNPDGSQNGWSEKAMRLATPEELEYINFPNKLEELLK